MAGNVNSQPRALARTATRFKQLFIAQFQRKADSSGNQGQYAAMVPLTLRGALGQTANMLEIQDSTGAVKIGLDLTGAATGLGIMRVAHARYSFAVDGGVIGLITPVSNAVIPANAIIVAANINSPTALVGATATISVGTSAGSSAASLLAATAVASYSANALLNGVPTFAVPVKMSAAGSVTLTVATAALTAGIVDVNVLYFVAGS